MTSSIKATLAFAGLSLLLSQAAMAASFNEIVAFGDSLSDAGNASIATLSADPPAGYATRSVPGVPFSVGYYTNPQVGSGPSGLWIDQLAANLGVPDPQPALGPLGGTNFAIGSATTGTGLVSMTTEVSLFSTSVGGVAPSNALYTFWGGANDIFGGLSGKTAADNIAAQIAAVAGEGGQNFLWLNLPSLGDVPELAGNPVLAGLANLSTQQFDAEWAADLALLQAQGINVTGVDVNSLFNQILANPAAYGFTNVTTACMATPGCNPNTALYWDGEHPTTYADSLVAGLATQSLNPTPEPASITLVGLGAAGMLAFFRLRKPTLAQVARTN